MMKRVSSLLVFVALWSLSCYLADAQDAVPVREIGSRRELFIDKYLVERLDNASLKLHEPTKTLRPQSPLIGAYVTVIKDGDLFRAVYRSYDPAYKGEQYDGNPGEMTCYVESRDGHEWTQPKLGVVEINGSRENNVILRASPFSTNFSPFLDNRANVPAEQRFKATAGLSDHAVKHAQNTKPSEAAGIKGGLYTFASLDCIHWKQLSQEPAITLTEFGFDSQNVTFWSPVEKLFVCYFRSWQNGLRSISRSTSPDFVTWSKPVPLSPNLPGEHVYTSQTHPYFRAPHLYVALPTRFHPGRGDSTDILLMTARGDAPYDRTFREAFIRPGLDPARWGNRSNYAALNVVPTSPNEMSIYHVGSGDRFVLRTDGFASVHVGADVGELLTRPLRFTGKELVINYSTSAGGSVRFEVQDESGQPIPGFTLADSRNLVGDAIEQPVSWKQGSDVSSLSSQTVRLRFVMQEADLFSLQFRQ
ncbi:MAG: hypothetical protein NT013_26700 [Planctomycetia bacterium]|nr:hypothetical protein [Planctomycetia bacterium]